MVIKEKKIFKSQYPIHPEGWRFCVIILSISLVSYFVWMPISIVGLLASLFVIWFFRDPRREAPECDGVVISAADGKVCLIDEVYPPSELRFKDEKMLRICVFMNVFNVHVNRSPIAGRITEIAYTEGKFFNASLDKASEKNERSSMVLEASDNVQIVVVQIAGLIARRILGFVAKGQKLSQGERFGLIRFGSRVDIYMPLTAIIECKIGDKVRAGETVLAILPNDL